MRTIAAILAGLLFLVPGGAASAPAAVTIRPGETVTLKIENNAVKVIQRAPAGQISDFDALLLRKMQMTDVPPDATALPGAPVYREEFPVDPPQTVPETVQITLRQVPGVYRGSSVHSMLTLLNGYPVGLRYHATMHANGRSSPTDVCGVMSARPGAEHWPYAIDWLELGDFRLEAFDDSSVPCE